MAKRHPVAFLSDDVGAGWPCPHCGKSAKVKRSTETMFVTVIECTCAGLVIPPTRNHYQLATWIVDAKLMTNDLQNVTAEAYKSRTDTDRPVGRLRHVGKGREGLTLVVRLEASYRAVLTYKPGAFRRHDGAREWVAMHLRHRQRPTIRAVTR